MATDTPMQLGMVGLGRMGAGIVRRLLKDGHDCVGYDVSADAVKELEADGAVGSTSLEDFAARLEKPRGSGSWCPRARSRARRSPRSPTCWSRTTSSSTAGT